MSEDGSVFVEHNFSTAHAANQRVRERIFQTTAYVKQIRAHSLNDTSSSPFPFIYNTTAVISLATPAWIIFS
jgi:hypothetical protein